MGIFNKKDIGSNTLQREAMKAVKEAQYKPLHSAKTGFGKMIQNRRALNFERAKLNTLNAISKRSTGALTKGLETATKLGGQITAAVTAHELNKGDSYRNSLSAWMRNISGNPTGEGSEGQTQTGSTSELGG